MKARGIRRSIALMRLVREVFEYAPTDIELTVAAAVWAFGVLVCTLLAKVLIAIEQGGLRYHGQQGIGVR